MASETDYASGKAISDFVREYRKTRHFHSKSAEFAHGHCQSLLQCNAIRAIVSSRTKQVCRLENKLKDRATKLKRKYSGPDDILEDIVDLAGVRIALYFPNDAEKIAEIITDSFDLVERKSYPEPQKFMPPAQRIVSNDVQIKITPPAEGKSGSQAEMTIHQQSRQDRQTTQSFKSRFGGYVADHYRVRIRRQDLKTRRDEEDFEGIEPMPMIEIQVASVLMHAWAEVNHDLVYKTLTAGCASDEELRLLDATNGLVQSGEVLLQQLQLAVETRVTYQKEPFQDQYELSSFLRRKYQLEQTSTDHFSILFEVLKELRLDSPMKLGESLEGWLPVSGPIALSILDHIMVEPTEQEPGSTGNPLGLKPRPLSIDQIVQQIMPSSSEIMIMIDAEAAYAMYMQAEILDRAVGTADAMLYPLKSLLHLSTFVARKFHEMHTNIIGLRHEIRVVFPLASSSTESSQPQTIVPKKLLYAVDQMWTWFQGNDDFVFRVSLKLARLPIDNIVGILTATHASTTDSGESSNEPILPQYPRSPEDSPDLTPRENIQLMSKKRTRRLKTERSRKHFKHRSYHN